MDYHNGNEPRLDILTAPRRNNYFYGKLMDELHFRMEQTYINRKRWLLNRLSLGTGVLCGLKVEAKNGQVCVSPGVAIDALGREIIVPTQQYLDPWTLADACGQVGVRLSPTEAHQVHICLAYRECTADYMPVLVADCNTQEQCAPGTMIESFCLLVQAGAPDGLSGNDQLCEVLTAIADSTQPEITLADRRRSLCEAALGDCVTPPEKPCVCLATIELQSDGTNGTIGNIDNCTCRPVVYSNTMLLELILCLAERIEECCGAPPVALDLPVVKAIWPPKAALLAEHLEWLNSWNLQPRLEITFNRQMDPNRLNDPTSWLRLWELRSSSRNQTQVRFIKLAYAGPTETPILGQDGITEVYTANELSSGAGNIIGYIVQIRAEVDNNIVDTTPTHMLLDADFAGTGLVGNLLDTIWDIFSEQDIPGQAVQDGLVDTEASLPSGNGVEGGHFHSWFRIRRPS